MRLFKGKFELRLNIGAKISVLFLSLSIVLIATLSYVDFVTSAGYIKRKIFGELTTLSKFKADFITSVIEENIEDAKDISSRISIREVLSRLEAQEMERGMASGELMVSIDSVLEAQKNVIDMDILDRDGMVIASSVPDNMNKFFYGEDFFFIGKETTYMSDPFFYKDKFVYTLAVPIPHLGGHRSGSIGVIRITMDAGKIYTILTDWTSLGKTAEIVMGKRQGQELVFLSPLKLREGWGARISVKSGYAVPMELATSGMSGIAEAMDYGGRQVLAAYDYIPLTGWGLVVKVEKSEAYGAVQELVIRVVIIAFVLLALSAYAVLRFARFISRPIKRLQEATEIMANGNLNQTIEPSTADEIGDLTKAFNNMTSHLKEITVSRDSLNKEIAERIKAEKELQRAVKAKTDFTSMVSHELRTPLAAIREGISMIIDGLAGPINEEQQDYLGIAKANVDRLNRLINDILDYQKLESGKADLKMSGHDIGEIIRSVVDIMTPLASKKKIALIVDIHGVLPRAAMDYDRMTQVLTNLVNNAIKFTEKGYIKIKAVEDNGAIHVIVKDTGIGISEADLPRLFRNFEQLNGHAKLRGGTGLGLVISKEIIELHEGKIWVESVLGKGTKVHFTLPL